MTTMVLSGQQHRGSTLRLSCSTSSNAEAVAAGVQQRQQDLPAAVLLLLLLPVLCIFRQAARWSVERSVAPGATPCMGVLVAPTTLPSMPPWHQAPSTSSGSVLPPPFVLLPRAGAFTGRFHAMW